MTVFRYTNKGSRKENQDYISSCSLSKEGAAVYVVADGMGGYEFGDLAAKVIATSITDYIAENIFKQQPGPLLKEAFLFANESLSIKKWSLNAKEMGAVVVVLLIIEEMAYMAWLGDSRIYFYRNGKLVYRTKDHSMVEELSKVKLLTAEDLERYSSIVTRALMGDEEKETPDLIKTGIVKCDTFILCSDGLFKQLEVQSLIDIEDMELKKFLDSIADKMDDNFSLVRVKI